MTASSGYHRKRTRESACKTVGSPKDRSDSGGGAKRLDSAGAETTPTPHLPTRFPEDPKELLRQPPAQVDSRADLRAKLAVQAGGVVFTTIQKISAASEGAEELIVEIVAVGQNDDRVVLHRRIANEALGIERHPSGSCPIPACARRRRYADPPAPRPDPDRTRSAPRPRGF